MGDLIGVLMDTIHPLISAARAAAEIPAETADRRGYAARAAALLETARNGTAGDAAAQATPGGHMHRAVAELLGLDERFFGGSAIDCATHDMLVHTDAGGVKRLEIKTATLEDGRNSHLCNAGGAPYNMHLAACLGRIGGEIEWLLMSAAELREFATKRKDGGWGLNITPRRAERWREDGTILGLEAGWEKLLALPDSPRSR